MAPTARPSKPQTGKPSSKPSSSKPSSPRPVPAKTTAPAPETRARKPRSIYKLPRLPASAKVSKRPLLRQPIPSPYSSDQKIVFVSSRTPLVSALKRVRRLLRQIEKRRTQGAMENLRGPQDFAKRVNAAAAAAAQAQAGKAEGGDGPRRAARGEEVLIQATGKAIPKVVELAGFFKGLRGASVRIETGSVDAIDDVETPEGEEVPETRVRKTNVLVVGVSTA